MIESLIESVAHFGGPDQQIMKVGAGHVSEFIDAESLAFMLANHFDCTASMQNILTSFPKVRWLTIAGNGQSISAKLQFEFCSPMYVAPLSLVCTYETKTASTIIAGSQAELNFEPWEQTAMRLRLIGPNLDAPIC